MFVILSNFFQSFLEYNDRVIPGVNCFTTKVLLKFKNNALNLEILIIMGLACGAGIIIFYFAMDDITIISYPGIFSNNLLSLGEEKSRYMLAIGGRFRVVDFTVRNAFISEAKKMVIYNNFEDDLEDYLENYGPYKSMSNSPIRVITREYSDVKFFHSLVMESNTSYYIIYNGDNPSLIDFSKIVKKYIRNNTNALLLKIKLSDGHRATMAHTVLITSQKNLLRVLNDAIDESRYSPNIFEMIINVMINKGIMLDEFEAHYWPIKSVLDYYLFNMKVMKDEGVSSLIHNESQMMGYIKGENSALIERGARVVNSFLSDSCIIYGTVVNSILFPGVEIGERSVIEDSIILPFNKIGSGTRIVKTVLDERTKLNFDDEFPNIGNRCDIGTNDDFIKNRDFPKSLYRSITLIGKNCQILNDSNIGGACYVVSGGGRDYFSKSKYLDDGLSLFE